MESKKLQQLQQANSHLAPIPQTKAPAFHPQTGDYRPPRSPVFQNHPQYQSLASNFAQINLTNHQHQMIAQHQNPHMKVNNVLGAGGGFPQQAQQQQQPQHHHNLSHYHGEQVYQTVQAPLERERVYQSAPQRNVYPQNHTHVHQATRLQQQYQQLQQEKMQLQIKTQTEAIALQHQTFALRQQLNPPPIPAQPHFHMQQPNTNQNIPQQHHHAQQQQQHRSVPPSSLNLTNHFQPAPGPVKMTNHNKNDNHYGSTSHHQMHQHMAMMHLQNPNQRLQQNQNIYQQNQHIQKQMIHNKIQNNLQSPQQNQIIIQQNNPGQVVNQASQTQIAGVSHKQNQKTPSENQSPSHEPLERRKSGPIHSLKSPVTKRSANAPVTLSGWLYKQGSEGLKVWRKRWFVLSEYCLFYYKGQEEEKLLGSVLLPSYKISACFPEDKVYRKYAFKCEHANMRTYWFAAETAESMALWVRSLTLATMMQGSSGSESQPSISSLLQSAENSDSGIHTYQSQQSKLSVPPGPVTPASDNGGGAAQPLYANAPPKPRRATDGGYSSPSPENSIERYDIQQNIYTQQPKSPIPPADPIYESRTNTIAIRQKTKSPDPVLAQRLLQIRLENNKSPSVPRNEMKSPYPDNQSPQIYPKSAGYPPKSTQVLNEQIYGDREKMERELYMQKVLQQQQQQQSHQQQQQLQQQLQQRNIAVSGNYPNLDRRTPDTYGPPRGGSDQRRHFSDYEDIYNLTGQPNPNQPIQPGEVGSYRRPMSPVRYNSNSQIPNMPMRYTPNYLEPPASQHIQIRARPAQTMVPRPHSADFLEYESRNPITTRMKAEPARAPRPKSSLDINRAPDNYYYSEASYAEKMRLQSASYLQKPSTMPIGASCSNKMRVEDQDNISSSTIPRESDVERANRLGLSDDTQGAASVPRVHRTSNMNSLKGYPSQQEQFLRSASARLPRKEEETTIRDGERKREESMKRLLEWKQRMLQSPLTRKINQQLTVTPTGTMNSGKTPIAQTATNLLNPGIQRSRSETHANAEYNSYSSDDEASISVRNVKSIPKVHLTVKPEPSDPIDINRNPFIGDNMDPPSAYYNGYNNNIEEENYIKPEVQFESTHDLYAQVQMQRHHDINLQQQQYQVQNGGRGMLTPNQQWQFQHQPQHSSGLMRRTGSQRELHAIERERENSIILRSLNMSAGDLLNRTHEELVLLLIQLRRQNSTTARSIEQCCTDIHEVQNRIRTSEGQSRLDNLSRLEILKLQLIDLEKQYEKSKPLVNLVDNMVKLGSLYRGIPGQNRGYSTESVTLDRLEFNQRVQERRLLQEEQRHWDRLSPNHTELQSKVHQLYQIDQLLQEESGTLQSLQRDKEDLERALGCLRAKMQSGSGPPNAVEAARRQQHTLERELSRVHLLLAENSKKLEQTVASNARLEQELLVLRQKLQASRDSRGSQSALGGQDNSPYSGGATAVLESELRRVQQLVGDMQRQRQELSQAVRQLTDNSNSLYQQMNKNGEYVSSHIKKRTQLTPWMETDLDSMVSIDQSISVRSDTSANTTPLYIETGSVNSSSNILNCSASSRMSDYDSGSSDKLANGKYYHRQQESNETVESSGMDSDDLLEGSVFANLSNQDKQEIKTVRIVKRESERRHRDRERTERGNTFSNQNLDQVLEEESQQFDDYNGYNRSKSLPRQYETHEIYQQTNIVPPINEVDTLPMSFSTNQYPDYYSMANTNSYPVSMIDRKADLYTDYGSQTAVLKASSYNNNYSLLNNPANDASSGLKHKTESIQSLTKTIGELSPVFQSEAAKQIIHEMNNGTPNDDPNQKLAQQNKQRRAVPKEKRRHHTAPHHLSAKSMQVIQSENDMNRNNINWRARDDLDMEVALRPRINAPDVVRSALGPREKISENTIDKLLAAPSKILIPERYVPEQPPELSPEEKKRRQEKVEAIKKMLSETPSITGNDSTVPNPPSAEKKQREHLLQLNQILAQQVMQMSKIVADQSPDELQDQDKSMAVLPSTVVKINHMNQCEDFADADLNDYEEHNYEDDDDDLESPADPLPLYQQRENYFT